MKFQCRNVISYAWWTKLADYLPHRMLFAIPRMPRLSRSRPKCKFVYCLSSLTCILTTDAHSSIWYLWGIHCGGQTFVQLTPTPTPSLPFDGPNNFLITFVNIRGLQHNRRPQSSANIADAFRLAVSNFEFPTPLRMRMDCISNRVNHSAVVGPRNN